MLFRYFIFLIIFSCGSNKGDTKLVTTTEIIKICPEDGTCTFDILQNKTLEIIYHDLNKPSPEVISGSNIVIKFEYKRNEIPNASDGHYSEIIYLELSPNKLELQLEDTNLQQVKLLFGRFCYCKGQTGYYQISNGSLAIKKRDSDNLYDFNLIFKTDEVPQIISEINETFRL